ncbi:MAG: hypothetical protein HOE90_03960 [Bacteriovoracaceae bacterium]|nr:hypothetical protein [Bacteriovoracaceae bacterium]
MIYRLILFLGLFMVHTQAHSKALMDPAFINGSWSGECTSQYKYWPNHLILLTDGLGLSITSYYQEGFNGPILKLFTRYIMKEAAFQLNYDVGSGMGYTIKGNTIMKDESTLFIDEVIETKTLFGTSISVGSGEFSRIDDKNSLRLRITDSQKDDAICFFKKNGLSPISN